MPSFFAHRHSTIIKENEIEEQRHKTEKKTAEDNRN